jgi:bacteriorhodopsin
MRESVPPWNATLTTSEHTIILYFLVVAGFALVGGTIRAFATRNEVGSRYRPAVIARMSAATISAISYVIIVVEFVRGYTLTAAGYRPNDEAILSFLPRYMNWSVTVPILTIELLAVCTLAGLTSRRIQGTVVASSFLMIFCGFMGAFVVDEGTNRSALVVWGAIGVVFWIFTNVVLARAVRQSYAFLTPQAATLLRDSTVLLLSSWIIYPVVFVIQIVWSGGEWTTVVQVALCLTDVLVKIGFGGLIHRVAKLRTAEDVRAGDDVHPESIWMSSIKLSDAGRPHEVYLAEGGQVHRERRRPVAGVAVPTQPSYPPEDSAE